MGDRRVRGDTVPVGRPAPYRPRTDRGESSGAGGVRRDILTGRRRGTGRNSGIIGRNSTGRDVAGLWRRLMMVAAPCRIRSPNGPGSVGAVLHSRVGEPDEPRRCSFGRSAGCPPTRRVARVGERPHQRYTRAVTWAADRRAGPPPRETTRHRWRQTRYLTSAFRDPTRSASVLWVAGNALARRRWVMPRGSRGDAQRHLAPARSTEAARAGHDRERGR